MATGGLGLRFGPGLARTSSWRDGGASGRSREAWGAENRAGVARMAVAADGGEARAALLLAARGRRKGGENGHGSGRGDKDGCASAAGEVRQRPTRGDADVEVGGELSENRGGTVTKLRDF